MTSQDIRIDDGFTLVGKKGKNLAAGPHGG